MRNCDFGVRIAETVGTAQSYRTTASILSFKSKQLTKIRSKRLPTSWQRHGKILKLVFPSLSIRQFKMLVNFFLLLVVLTSFAVAGTQCVAADGHVLARKGGQMKAAEIASLEAKLVESPNDVEARTKVLGYYFITGRNDAEAKPARMRHVLWLIENAPESEVLGLPYGHLNKILEREAYASAKEAWEKALSDQPGNTAVIANASKFFLLHDREAAELLLLRGQEADADDETWAVSLGQLYSLGLTSLANGDERIAAARKAFNQYQRAYDGADASSRGTLLSDLAKTAFEAGLFDEAKKYADEMLAGADDGWNAGNQIHQGNLVLGRIALLTDDVEEAKKRLLAAGATSGSPQLNSFGPNMTLAKELLERGEKDVVLEYFALCDNFWKSPRRKLDHWIDEVKASRIPDFGANLAY